MIRLMPVLVLVWFAAVAIAGSTAIDHSGRLAGQPESAVSVETTESEFLSDPEQETAMEPDMTAAEAARHLFGLPDDPDLDTRPVVRLYTAGPPWPSWCGPCNTLHGTMTTKALADAPVRIEPCPAEDSPSGRVPCFAWTAGEHHYVYHTSSFRQFIRTWQYNHDSD